VSGLKKPSNHRIRGSVSPAGRVILS
jgi:hypothetical protein